MSSEENDSDNQSEPVETAQTSTNNETKVVEDTSFITSQENTDVTEELETEEEICEESEYIYKTELAPVHEEIREITYSFSIFEIVPMIYNNPYYWAIFKRTML